MREISVKYGRIVGTGVLKGLDADEKPDAFYLESMTTPAANTARMRLEITDSSVKLLEIREVCVFGDVLELPFDERPRRYNLVATLPKRTAAALMANLKNGACYPLKIFRDLGFVADFTATSKPAAPRRRHAKP